MTEDEGLAQLSMRHDDRNVSLESLLLVSSQEVVTAARKWHDAVFALRRFARNEGDFRTRDFSKLYTEAGEKRRLFYYAARKDLDVPGKLSTLSTEEISTTEE